MTTNLIFVAERFLNTPLFLSAAKAETLYSVLEGRIGVSANVATVPMQHGPEASRFVGDHRRKTRSGSFVRAKGKTALITIDGSLVNRGAWLNSNSGLVSYEGIGAQIDDIAADEEIESVVLDIDSSGGEATGMFGLAAKIRALRSKKRIVAVVNDVAASAAYGIASAAHEIVVSPTSVVGSIGVIMVHFDRSGELGQKGIRPTIIAVGEHKADGNPFGPLPEGVHASMLANAQTFYDQFIDAVAAGRGQKLTASLARQTQARIFIGQQAIKSGLADRMASLDEVMSGLARRTTKRPTKTGGQKAMSTLSYEAEQAVLAERQRISAILRSPEAQSRMEIAMDFALTGDMSAETAKAALSKLPTAAVYQTIQQRAEGAAEIGSSYSAPQSEEQRAASTAKLAAAFGAQNKR